jgi:hypothetical protein
MDREKIFPNAVIEHFSFLLDFGFTIFEKEECDTDAFGNGYYRFKSDTVGVEIVLDRGQVLVKIGKIYQARSDWLEWSYIVKAYAPELTAYDFELDIASQIRRISELLRRYCMKLLDGNFADENLLKELEDSYGKNFLQRFLQEN